MCIITFVPANVELPVDSIKQGSIRNRDGHGWALASKNGLFVGKSMDFDEALDSLIKTRYREGLNSIVVFHSRFATHGLKNTDNVHPFFVGDDEQTVMAHNGIMPSMFHPEKDDQRSDTRVFADSIGSFVENRWGVPSRRGGIDLGHLIGGGNKLVFLSVKNGPKARLINSHLGIWDGGVWYSNTGYQKPKYSSAYSSAWADDWGWYGSGHYSGRRNTVTRGGTAAGSPLSGVQRSEQRSFSDIEQWWADREAEAERAIEHDFKCPRCGEEEDVDWISMYCPTCYYCLDCKADMNDCMCFVPGARQGRAQPETCEPCETTEILDDEQLTSIFRGIVDKMDERAKDRWLVDSANQGTLDTSPIAQEIIRQREKQSREMLALPSGEMKALG